MGNAPGFVLIAVIVVVIAWSIARSSRRRERRRAVVRHLAQVLEGTVDDHGHAVGTFGPYGVDAHVGVGSGTPTDLASSASSHLQVPQLHVRLRSPVQGGGLWSCRRNPPWPGGTTSIEWVSNPTGFLPGATRVLGRLGIEQLDDGGRDRLRAAGLFEAVDALGQGVSGWLPQVSRMAAPALPPALMAGHGGDGAGGAVLSCVVELADGPDLTPERFREYLGAMVRIAEIDAQVNR